MTERESQTDLSARAAEGRSRSRLRIVPYSRGLAADFRRLNLEWLERYFHVEPTDEALFANPEEVIIAPGGHVLFAMWLDDDGSERAVGTCALLRDGRDFELAKMAVTGSHRGLGIGRALLEASIEIARRSGAEEVTLLTNSTLRAALELYRSAGFVVRRLGPDPRYVRVDTIMTLPLVERTPGSEQVFEK